LLNAYVFFTIFVHANLYLFNACPLFFAVSMYILEKLILICSVLLIWQLSDIEMHFVNASVLCQGIQAS